MKSAPKLSLFTRATVLSCLLTTSLHAQWIAAGLTDARKNLAAATAGSKAIFAGGNDEANTSFATVDMYDYITGKWTTHTLSKGRQALRAASFGDKAFFAGGAGPSLSAVVDIYDDSKTTNQWSSFSLAIARAHIGMAAAGGKVFFAGGQSTSGGAFTDVIEVYDINSGKLVGQKQMSVARGYLSATAVGSKVFFAGGIDNTGAFVDAVDIYDTSTSTWVYTNLPSGARSHLTAVTNDMKAFFAGGRDGSVFGSSRDVDIYDVISGNWEPSVKLSEARGYLHSASVGDNVFFAGGFEGTANLPCDLNDPDDPNLPEHITRTSETVDIYDISTGKMLAQQALPGGKRFSLAATSVGSQLLFGGGAGPCNEASAAVDIYETDPLIKITGTDFPLEMSASDKISITVDDASKASLVKVFVHGVSDPDAPFTSDAATTNGNSFEYIPDLSDKIGVVYFFEVTDTYMRRVYSDTVTSYNYYTAGSSALEIPGLKHGNTEGHYQMIAIPLMLANKQVLSTFNSLGAYNIKKWRLYDFNNGDNREYPGFSTIEPGRGYWLITRDAATISTGAGSTVRKSRGVEFEMTLPTGWSLIGNPYNFRISWADVQDYNPGFSESQKLKVFNNGTLEETITIDRYRGAFAYNSGSAVTLQIPAKRNSSLGGRIASPQEVDLAASNWQLPLELTDGALTNQLGGIGMNKLATQEGLDEFDGLSVPMPEGMGMSGLAFSHPEIGTDFSREVVPAQDEYVWDFEIRRGSDKPLTLSWDNESIRESEKELYLFDPSGPLMKNMKINNGYTLPLSTTRMQVLLGSPDYINRKKDEWLPLFDNPYPNPANEKVIIPFRITEAAREMEVSIKVYSMLGAEISTVAEGTFQKGSHEVVWNSEGQSGLFLIHMKANNQQSKWVKILVR